MRHKTGSGCIFRGIKRREQKENNTEPGEQDKAENSTGCNPECNAESNVENNVECSKETTGENKEESCGSECPAEQTRKMKF